MDDTVYGLLYMHVYAFLLILEVFIRVQHYYYDFSW